MARAKLESEIRARFDAQDFAGAATIVFDGYGPEVLGFLAGVLRDEDAAREVWAETAVTMWQELPRFRWDASIRTWLYVLARAKISAHLDRPARHGNVRLSDAPEVQTLIARSRTTTIPWKRSEVKDGIARLRDALPAADRALLILRIDRGLPWKDVAEILGDPSEPALRKRFERIKTHLKEEAAKLGLTRAE